MHPEQTPEAEGRLKQESSAAKAVLGLIAQLLPLWPREPRLPRVLREPRSDRLVGANRKTHDWHFAGGKWQCRVCLAFARSDARAASRAREVCNGHSTFLNGLLKAPQGHNLLIADVDDTILVACSKCGSWMTTKPVGLARACAGVPSLAGIAALKRISRGVHPTCGATVAGIWSLSQCLEVEVKTEAEPSLPPDAPPSRGLVVSDRIAAVHARCRARFGASTGA
jgi:hypothetical protein